MHGYLISILLIIVSCLGGGLSVKDEISMHQASLERADSESAPLTLVQLAKAYLKDQELERGVKTFLQALDSKPPPQYTYRPGVEETKLYEEALRLYLSSPDLMKISQRVLQEYGKIVEAHQDYYKLNYLVSVSYANLGMFDRFFDSFFHSFTYLPQEYLAFKARAVLHTFLGKAISDAEKAQHKGDIFHCAQAAIEMDGRDIALYKMLIVYANTEERHSAVVKTLEAIIEKNIVVPRTDVVFYVEKAASMGELELASKFLAKAKEWYAYSRVLQQAEELLVEGGGDYGK